MILVVIAQEPQKDICIQLIDRGLSGHGYSLSIPWRPMASRAFCFSLGSYGRLLLSAPKNDITSGRARMETSPDLEMVTRTLRLLPSFMARRMLVGRVS